MSNLLKEHWNRLVGCAASLMTLFSGFVAAPPSSGAGDMWFAYGKFLVAVLAGLLLLPMRIWSAREHAWQWWAVALAMAVGSTAVFLHYNQLLDRWTVPYWRDRRAVVGSVLTPDAQHYLLQQTSQGQPMDDLRLLKSYGGNAASVWNSEEISQRENRLVSWYLTAILLLAGMVIAIAQASYCLGRKPRRAKASSP
ncbi:MAG: hypothetical protein JO323_02740 [Acidobacteriia bacterium]|nr:hypothetical protein [Terriglobia bacterium]